MCLVVFVDYLLIDFDVLSDHEQWFSFESFREGPRLSLLLTLCSVGETEIFDPSLSKVGLFLSFLSFFLCFYFSLILSFFLSF